MDNRIYTLSKYRMEKAKDDYETSKILFKKNKFSQSVNRSYYAIFHAIRSLLALKKFDSSKHSGIISYFIQQFIKTGEIEIEFSKMLTLAYKLRSDCDYKDFYTITKEDAELQLENANRFIKRIQVFLEQSDFYIQNL